MRVHQRARIKLPIRTNELYSRTELVTFDGLSDDLEHIAIIFRNADEALLPLVRMHSECLTGDVFRSARCDCGNQLSDVVKRFSSEGGIILYLRQEGRGIGLTRKIDAYLLQESGADTFEANHELGLPADARNYTSASEMLEALGVSQMVLLTNNPDKVSQMTKLGPTIVRVEEVTPIVTPENRRYLRAKAEKAGHNIERF